MTGSGASSTRGLESPTGSTPAPSGPDLVGAVIADVDGYGTAPLMVGANVTAFNTTCSTTPPLPTSCPVVGWTTTNASGGFEMALPVGQYYVAVHPDSAILGGAYPYGFGGDSKSVDLTSTANVNLSVYPFVPYGNATLVLPGYVCDAQYLNDVGGDGPGCQNPVLSWTQDGAYYVNASSELVFYSFVNRTVDPIAPWTLLYQRFPGYSMIPNELFITQDGSYLYGWGTLAPGSALLTAEAVNVTTHRVWQFTFSGLTAGSVAANGQVQLTGWDGNDSDLTLILANGSIYEHDLWSSGLARVAQLDFFEANNVYWEPYLNGYVNVQADGSTSDHVKEWQLQGPVGYALTRTFEGAWGSSRMINGVNGIALNLTDRTLSFGLGGTNNANTVVAALNSTGAITGFASVVESSSILRSLGPGAASDRPTILTTGPAVDELYDGLYNSSWLVQLSPGHLGFETTNLSGAYEYGGSPPAYGWSQWSQEGQFYNASYLIAPNSYACNEEFADSCTVNGTGGAAVGTVWWYWELGDPEFPFSPTAPAAETVSPPPTVVTVRDVTSSTAALNWTSAGSNGAVYYSVDWGTTPSEGQVTWLPGDVTAYTLTGLPSGSRVYISVAGWNLHYAATGSPEASVVTEGLTPPTGVSVTARTASTLQWSWTQSPAAGIVNNTLSVFAGSDCSGVPRRYSTDGPATNVTVGGLTAASPYSAYVTAWNVSSQSSPSDCAAGLTRLGGAQVTFTESGLPTGAAWYVNITPGPSLVSSGALPTTNVTLANGTYELRVATNDKILAPTSPAMFTVSGTPVAVSVVFSPYLVPVAFGEGGLPPGTNWSVKLGPVRLGSVASTIVFDVSNGTYPFAVSGVPGWHLFSTPYVGSIVVDGAAVSETLNFSEVTYTVSFSETGLPNGTTWTVFVQGLWWGSNYPAFNVYLPNGTFSFSVGGVPGYRASLSSGTVTVNATNGTERVSFTRLPSPFPIELVVGAGVTGALATAAVVLYVRRRRRKAADGASGGTAEPRS